MIPLDSKALNLIWEYTYLFISKHIMWLPTLIWEGNGREVLISKYLRLMCGIKFSPNWYMWDETKLTRKKKLFKWNNNYLHTFSLLILVWARLLTKLQIKWETVHECFCNSLISVQLNHKSRFETFNITITRSSAQYW